MAEALPEVEQEQESEPELELEPLDMKILVQFGRVTTSTGHALPLYGLTSSVKLSRHKIVVPETSRKLPPMDITSVPFTIEFHMIYGSEDFLSGHLKPTAEGTYELQKLLEASRVIRFPRANPKVVTDCLVVATAEDRLYNTYEQELEAKCVGLELREEGLTMRLLEFHMDNFRIYRMRRNILDAALEVIFIENNNQ